MAGEVLCLKVFLVIWLAVYASSLVKEVNSRELLQSLGGLDLGEQWFDVRGEGAHHQRRKRFLFGTKDINTVIAQAPNNTAALTFVPLYSLLLGLGG